MAFDHAAYMRMRRAKEHRAKPVPTLDWPTNLFGQPFKIDDLMAIGGQRIEKGNTELLCSCGCGKPHNLRVSHTVRGLFGTGWQVIYFATGKCKSEWVRKKPA